MMLPYRLGFAFATAPLKRYGLLPQVMPNLPQINFASRQYVEGEQQIPKKEIYNFLGNLSIIQDIPKSNFQGVDISYINTKGRSIMCLTRQGIPLEG